MGLFNELNTGLDELISHAKGDKTLRKKIVKFKDVPEYKAQDIKDLRYSVKLSQKSLAELVGVSNKTVEAWEAGTNKPSGPSLRLLQLLEDNPQVMLENIIERSNQNKKINS